MNSQTATRSQDQSLEDRITSRIARYETRTYDWDALKFQADFDPKYKRAQMRYMGTGGTGLSSDENTVPSEHFTFSTMVLPPGSEGPMHVHADVERVDYALGGNAVGRRELAKFAGLVGNCLELVHVERRK